MRLLSSRLFVISSAIALYGSSLYLPAFSYIPFLDKIPESIARMPGWAPLVFGAVAVLFAQVAAISFLANPSFFAAFIAYCAREYKLSEKCSAASFVLGLAFFPLDWIRPVMLLFSGEGETLNHPIPMIGYAVWMLTFLTTYLGAKVARHPPPLIGRTI